MMRHSQTSEESKEPVVVSGTSTHTKKSKKSTGKKKEASTGVEAAKRRFEDIKCKKVKQLALRELAIKDMNDELAVLRKVQKGGAHRVHIVRGLEDSSQASAQLKLVEQAFFDRLKASCESGYHGFPKKEEGLVHFESYFKTLTMEVAAKHGAVEKLRVYLGIWEHDLSNFLTRQMELGTEALAKTTKELNALGKATRGELEAQVKEARRWLRAKENAELNEQTKQAMLRGKALKKLEDTEGTVSLFDDKGEIHLMWKQEMDLLVLVEMLGKRKPYINAFCGRFSAASSTRKIAMEYAANLALTAVGSAELRAYTKINKGIGEFYKKIKREAKGHGTITKFEKLNTEMKKKLGKTSKKPVSQDLLTQLKDIVEAYIRELDTRVAEFGDEFVTRVLDLCKKAWNVDLASTERGWKTLVTKKKGQKAMVSFEEAHTGATSTRSDNLTEYYAELFQDGKKLAKYFDSQIVLAKGALKMLSHGLNVECDPGIASKQYKKEVERRMRLDHEKKVKAMKAGAKALKAMQTESTETELITNEADIRDMAEREYALEDLRSLYEKKINVFSGFATNFKRWGVMLAEVAEFQTKLEGIEDKTNFRNALAQWDVSYGKAKLPQTRNLGYAISKDLRGQMKKVAFPISSETALKLQKRITEKVEAARGQIFERADAFLEEMETSGGVLWAGSTKKKPPTSEPRQKESAQYFLYFWGTVKNDLKVKPIEKRVEVMGNIFARGGSLTPFFQKQLALTESAQKLVTKELNTKCDQTIRYKVQASVIASESPSKIREGLLF